MKNGIITLEHSLTVSKKVKHVLSINPEVLLLGTSSRSWMILNMFTQKHVSTQSTCTCKFMVALLLIAQSWKQLKFPSIGEQMKCGKSINEYHSAIYENEP